MPLPSLLLCSATLPRCFISSLGPRSRRPGLWMGSGILIRPGSLLHQSRRRRSGDAGRQRRANHPEAARALYRCCILSITPSNTHQSEYELGPELQKNLLEDLAEDKPEAWDQNRETSPQRASGRLRYGLKTLLICY